MATKSPVLFKFGTRADYDGLSKKQDNALYFLTDTGELLRGDVNLAQANYYEVVLAELETHAAAITRITSGKNLIKNDVCIVKELIAGDNYTHTAYVYNGEAWKAMDGNYNAENVYFDQDLIFTKEVGYIKPDSTGSATVAATGKNMKQLLEMMFSKETSPTVTQPSLTLSAPQNKSYEVGTQVTPSYSLTFNKGSYSYGPDTGITATYSVTDSDDSEPQTASSGVFAALTVGDDTAYTITAKASYTEGAIPKTNLGNDAENKKISAGEITKTSAALTGYRAFFYGATASDALTSAIIRKLKNGGKPSKQTLGEYAASTVSGAKKVIVAIPATSTLSITSVLLTSAMNADITDQFVKQVDPVSVEGANGYEGADYNVWIYQPAALDASETYSITLG